MRPTLGSALIIAILAAVLGAGAFLITSQLNIQAVSVTSAAPSGKDFLSPIAIACVSGLLLALLVLLIPERWRRIESEIQALRQGQVKAIDDLQRRADERLSEKLASATGQAQSILDHLSGLAERHPWIKGISEVGFSPNSNSCQIVLRNAAKLLGEGQGLIAHDYLFSWTQVPRDRAMLEGSPSDFIELATFSLLVLRDEFLAELMLSVGYRSRSRRLLLASIYLRALTRNGDIAEAFDVAEAIRRRSLPTWRDRLQEGWYKIRRIGKPTVRPPRPSTDDCSSLAILFGVLGDEIEFKRALKRGYELAFGDAEKTRIQLAEVEGLATLGSIEEAALQLNCIERSSVIANGLVFELVWALRRIERQHEAEEILSHVADIARQTVLGDVEGADNAGNQESVPHDVLGEQPRPIDANRSIRRSDDFRRGLYGRPRESDSPERSV